MALSLTDVRTLAVYLELTLILLADYPNISETDLVLSLADWRTVSERPTPLLVRPSVQTETELALSLVHLRTLLDPRRK